MRRGREEEVLKKVSLVKQTESVQLSHYLRYPIIPQASSPQSQLLLSTPSTVAISIGRRHAEKELSELSDGRRQHCESNATDSSAWTGGGRTALSV